MQLHDFALIFLAFVSELLGTVSGFGSSTFFVPTALLLETFTFVLALTAILHCFGNVFKIFLFRQHLNWKIIARLALPALVFTALGAALIEYTSVSWLQTALGVFLVAFAVFKLFFKEGDWTPPRFAGQALSALSGFLTGFVGTGGAVRGVALSSLNLSKDSFVAVSATIDIGGDFLRAGIYIANGYMDWRQWFYLPLLLLAALAGARLGKLLLGRINQAQFEKVVASFIFISGLLMIFKG